MTTLLTDVQIAGWALAADERHVELSSAYKTYQQNQTTRDRTLEEELDRASAVIRQRSTLTGWWYGREIEQAWSNLHEAEVRLVDLCPTKDLRIKAAEALEWARGLDSHDARIVELRAAIHDGESPRLRAATKGVLRGAQAVSDQRYKDARAFRNRLVVFTGLVLVALAGLLVLQWRLHRTSLVPVPTDRAVSGPLMLMVIVMVFGCIGGLLTAIPAIARIPRDRSPFNVPLPQSMLKIALGGLIAPIGIVLVSGGGSQGYASLQALIAPAIAFGAGQQAVTAFVDQRAKALLAPDAAPKA